MKVTDLMVGDWVRMPFGLPEIRQIKYSSEIGDAAFYEPIPLMGEILEKNGFDNSEGERYTMPKNSLVLYDWTNRFGIGVIERASGWYNFVELCEIRFVHELQHVLRICGIEKEIEL